MKFLLLHITFATLPKQHTKCNLESSVNEETYYQRNPHYEVNNVVYGLIDVDLIFKL